MPVGLRSIYRNSVLRSISILFSLGTIVFAYQNCGPGQFSEQSSVVEDSDTGGLSDANFAKLSFPFDVQVNQISYMSCPVNSNMSQWTFNVGAYDNTADATPYPFASLSPGGLRIRPQFIEEFNSTFKSPDPNYQKGKFKEALLALPALKKSQLHVSMRSKTQTRTVAAVRPLGAVNHQMSYALSPLSNDSIASMFYGQKDKLWQTSGAVHVHSFPTAKTAPERYLNANIVVPSAASYNDQNEFMHFIQNNLLVIGFADTDPTSLPDNYGPNPIAPVDASEAQMYGKGYRLALDRPVVPKSPNSAMSYPPRALVIVDEWNLESQSRVTADWNCNARFKIVRAADRFTKIFRTVDNGNCNVSNGAGCVKVDACPPESEQALHSSNEYLAVYNALRRVLPANQWDINISHRCVVPKTTACYAETAKVVYDEVFFDSGLVTADNGLIGYKVGCSIGDGQTSGAGGGQFPCAHYLTLCVRR